MDDFTFEQTYIGGKKNQFKSLFDKDPDKNLELFLSYLSEYTNRQLMHELKAFNKNYSESKENP